MSTELVHKYLVNAGVSAVAYKMASSQFGSQVVLKGVGAIPTWAVGAGLGLVSSAVSDVGVKAIIPATDLTRVLHTPGSAVLAPALSGATFVAGHEILAPEAGSDVGKQKMFVQGALAEIIAHWVHEQIVDPWLNDEVPPEYL